MDAEAASVDGAGRGGGVGGEVVVAQHDEMRAMYDAHLGVAPEIRWEARWEAAAVDEMRRKRVGGLRWNEEENAEGGGRGAHERARGGRIP